jgi:uncharacterized protein
MLRCKTSAQHGERVVTDIKQYKFFTALCNLTYVDEIILYGSRARGDYRERSDIDLAIKCPKANDEDWQAILRIIEDADTLLKIDCIKFETLELGSELHEAILREGKVLYVKSGK